MTEQARYQIQVQGWIGQRWTEWLDGGMIARQGEDDGSPTTTLTSAAIDQAALRGILSKLWDLNLTLVSVTRIDVDSRDQARQSEKRNPASGRNAVPQADLCDSDRCGPRKQKGGLK